MSEDDGIDFAKLPPIDFAQAQREMQAEFDARKKKQAPQFVRDELADMAEIRARENAAASEPRRSIDELKAKYGDNWGFATHDEIVEQRRKIIEAKLHEKRNVLFERECERYGMPKTSLVSPFLYRELQTYQIRMDEVASRIAADQQRLAAEEQARHQEAEKRKNRSDFT